MALNRKSLPDRELHKFVESPCRPGQPAVEVYDCTTNDLLIQLLAKMDDLIAAVGGETGTFFTDQSGNRLQDQSGNNLTEV